MHSGASVNAVTKSGTNARHGDLFEFFRNHRFNATDPFARVDPATGKRVDDGLNRNQFGATFGGPIRPDRLFFFGAYQGTKFRSTPSDLEAFVPTERMLNGDFSIFNSADVRAECRDARRIRQQPGCSVAHQSRLPVRLPPICRSQKTNAGASSTKAPGLRTSTSSSARWTRSCRATTRCSAATC